MGHGGDEHGFEPVQFLESTIRRKQFPGFPIQVRDDALQGPPGLFQLLFLAVQVEENPHLGQQDFRRIGLDDVVDRARFVAAEDVLFIRIGRGHENDRNQPGHGVPAQMLGQLQTTHARHHDIQNRDGEIVVERGGEGRVAVVRFNDLGRYLAQNLAQSHQILLFIVDDQDFLRRGHVRSPRIWIGHSQCLDRQFRFVATPEFHQPPPDRRYG